MKTLLGRHELLVRDNGRDEAEQHARHFFKKNVLVRYDSLQIDGSSVINANDPQFFTRLEAGLQKNRQAVEELVTELQQEGAADVKAWSLLQQGYATKLLHTAIHLLDGFFGTDSALYNLVENSNQATPSLMNSIKKTPEKYWLVPVLGFSASGEIERVAALRPFGREA